MDHVAIMRPSWGLLPKILSGQKTIESRWYKAKIAPWDRIAAGDTVYFKDSGRPVTARAKVAKVLQFSSLTPSKVRQILNEYGKQDGIEAGRIPYFYGLFEEKRCCILVFLESAESVTPFEIDKTGFGSMSAWISVGNIGVVKKK